jgi:hypothetical protein
VTVLSITIALVLSALPTFAPANPLITPRRPVPVDISPDPTPKKPPQE